MFSVGQKIKIRNIPDTQYKNLNVIGIITSVGARKGAGNYDYDIEIRDEKEYCHGSWGIYERDIITSSFNYND